MAERSNEDLIREGLEAWNRGDWEAALEMMDPDIEWRISQPLFDMPLVSHGREAVRAFWAQWVEIWDDIRVDVGRVVPFDDDGMAAFVRWRARGRDGVEVDQRVVFAFTLRNGKTTRFIAFWSPEEAVEALGLESA